MCSGWHEICLFHSLLGTAQTTCILEIHNLRIAETVSFRFVNGDDWTIYFSVFGQKPTSVANGLKSCRHGDMITLSDCTRRWVFTCPRMGNANSTSWCATPKPNELCLVRFCTALSDSSKQSFAFKHVFLYQSVSNAYTHPEINHTYAILRFTIHTCFIYVHKYSKTVFVVIRHFIISLSQINLQEA